MSTAPIAYAGFWRRLGAALVDTLLILLITQPLVVASYGWDYYDFDHEVFIAGPMDFLVCWLAPAVATVLFWQRLRATPGKLWLRCQVVDARTGQALSTRQACIRYLGYFLSTLALGLGFLWIAWDARKQGWHDKLAGSVVIRP
ncbi:RDD family protein [Inhella proteolytica]|uniref:RDD family protein n=1 Tax=Inhella proteolytica TaxID=2795029 RepID=A0A931J3R8_9BURK|nr:RDD family protein [Inhella proteolytica]MBH9577004.1 RDD family protein [Inhella proteolytica]